MGLTIGPYRRIANSPHYKWWAYGAIAVGLFLSVMDQTGVGIALPQIAEHFDADIPTVQWISLGYILSTSAMLMPMGRLSDMLGRKVVYMGGFIIFVGAAIAGGLSNALPMIILAKIVQGIGSAGIRFGNLKKSPGCQSVFQPSHPMISRSTWG